MGTKRGQSKLRLDGYIRVSRTNGRSGDSFISPDQQREKIKAWASLHGVTIAKWHQDLDQSGGKLSRPGFDDALERVQTGRTGGVVVSKLDRFSRAGVADALKLIESIIEAGGKVAAVEEGIDPTTPVGEFTMTLFLALARMQRQQIAETWSDARRRAVERGIHVASKVPTGYRRGDDGRLEPDPDSAPHIAELFRLKADGASWSELRDYLRQHEVASPYETFDWQPRAVSHLIANRVYLGEARSGDFTNPDAHEPIVDEDTWQAAQRAVGEKPVNGFGGALLSGLLRCGGCGYTLKPDSMLARDGEKLRLYRCRTERSSGRCPEPASTLGRVIEPFVISQFFAHIGTKHGEGTPTGAELEAAEQALIRARSEEAAYLDSQRLGIETVGAEAFWEGARVRRERVHEAEQEHDRLRDQAGLVEVLASADLEQDWPDLSVVEQRQILTAAFDAIVLSRGRVPIEDRTRVVWRGEEPVAKPDRRRKAQAA
jgi:DNA invertase Pin-like site-specific DNA recombinase